MSKDILRGFGPDSSNTQAPSAECGGILPGEEVDVMNYKAPVGPSNINDSKSPGIHGTNHGNNPSKG